MKEWNLACFPFIRWTLSFAHSRISVSVHLWVCVYVCCHVRGFILHLGEWSRSFFYFRAHVPACVLCFNVYVCIRRRKLWQLSHQERKLKETANRSGAWLLLWALLGGIFGIPVKLSECCCPDRVWIYSHASVNVCVNVACPPLPKVYRSTLCVKCFSSFAYCIYHTPVCLCMFINVCMCVKDLKCLHRL